MIVIIGPSGSGKTTLARELEKLGANVLVSHTTRPPREGEEDGKDYYFVTESEFDKLDFLESTVIHGNRYGLSSGSISETDPNKPHVFVSDVAGIRQIQTHGFFVLPVLLMPPLSVCRQRLEERGNSERRILALTMEQLDINCLEEGLKGKIPYIKITKEDFYPENLAKRIIISHRRAKEGAILT